MAEEAILMVMKQWLMKISEANQWHLLVSASKQRGENRKQPGYNEENKRGAIVAALNGYVKVIGEESQKTNNESGWHAAKMKMTNNALSWKSLRKSVAKLPI